MSGWSGIGSGHLGKKHIFRFLGVGKEFTDDGGGVVGLSMLLSEEVVGCRSGGCRGLNRC